MAEIQDWDIGDVEEQHLCGEAIEDGFVAVAGDDVAQREMTSGHCCRGFGSESERKSVSEVFHSVGQDSGFHISRLPIH